MLRSPGGGPYTLRFSFVTEAMGRALDVFVKTQNWETGAAQKELIAVLARILSQHGLGTVEEFLKPTVSAQSAIDEDPTFQLLE
jgi:hypothetical protein